jgi:hypothetical protein
MVFWNGFDYFYKQKGVGEFFMGWNFEIVPQNGFDDFK